MRSSTLLALAGSLSSSAAVYQGFNYGSTKSDGSFQYQADYEALFSTAKNLVGTSGFTSARLYTTVQGGSSTNDPTEAIPAAIAQDTSLLLGLWASGGQDGINSELTALHTAINKWGSSFTNLVAGISVGSEDLYRISPTGIAANSGYGADPDTLVSYIGQVRQSLSGTALSGTPIGHVDTWTAWVNGSNNAVSAACDWVGMDAYPYFQNTMANSETDGPGLFNDAFAATKAAVGGKPVWITETGWPVSGKTENLAVPSTQNAKAYWDAVACPNLGVVNTWWFTLQDAAPVTPNPSFGIVGSTLSTTPLYDLSCSNVVSSSSAAQSSTATGTSSSIVGSSTGSSTVVGGGSGSSVTASSVASSILSGASSLSVVASSTVLASSGGGLSPSQGGGVGGSSAPSGYGANPSTAGPTASITQSVGSNGTSVVTGSIKPTGTASSSTTAPSQSVQPASAGTILSGSVVAVLGAFLAVIVSL